MRRSLALLLCVLAFGWTTQLTAETRNSDHTLKLADGAKSPPAKIEDLAWLKGYWTGEGLGGQCEEAWGAPIGDRMFGWFSMRKEDKLVFSEAMTVVEVDGSLVMRIKHFDADFVGWEKKEHYVSFPLVKLEADTAYFSGLTFKRVEDRLEIYLVLANKGQRTEHKFEMSRTDW